MRTQLEQLDLLEPWPAMVLRQGYRTMNILVRVGVTPIGEIITRPLRRRAIPHERLRRMIEKRLARQLRRALLREGASAGIGSIDALGAGLVQPTGLAATIRKSVMEAQGQRSWPQPGVTVAVCTRDRAEQLGGCIEHLQKLDYPEFEIIIVDNSRDPVPARQIADHFGVGYVRCAMPAINRARNAAVQQAHYDWLAFVGDDCRVEPQWLTQLIRAAQDDNCRCAVGLTRPAELDSIAQVRLHEISTADDLSARCCTPNDPRELFRLAGESSLLVHKWFLESIGGFEEHSSDADFLRVALSRGSNIHFCPAAVAHRRLNVTPGSLRQHVYENSAERCSHLIRAAIEHGEARAVWDLIALPFTRATHPSLKRTELRGMLAGPWRYAMRRIQRSLHARRERARAYRPVPPGWMELPPARPRRLMAEPTGSRDSFRAA